MLKLEGKVAVITGGSSGIGLATARRLKAEGAKIIITGRNELALLDAAKELGESTLCIMADVSNLSDIDAMFQKVNNEFGKLDILFINAGMGRFASIANTSESLYDETFSINTKGAFFTLQKSIGYLNEGASIIINAIAPVTPSWRKAGTSVYTASKSTLILFMEAAAVELAAQNIRVNAVCPGPIKTSINKHAGVDQDRINERINKMVSEIPLKRIGEPEEVANVVAFLASSEASFITGRQIQIDGGMD